MRPRGTPVLLDVLLALVLTGLSVATLADRGGGSDGWLAGVLAVLAVAPVALRQVAPVATMLVIVAALVAYALLGYGDWPSSALGLLVAMFTVATLRPRRVAAALFPAAIAVIALAHRTVDGVTWAMAVQAGVTCLVAWALGDATRRWARQAEDAAARAARAVAEERTRIARELHDVVSHHMSVVALQSGLAEYVLDTDPRVARTAIGHAGAAGREALLDLRRMLDALRDEGAEDAPYEPQPGLDQIAELVARLRGTGLAVDLRLPAPLPDLAPGPALCAYRIVQESLTNVLKHAGPAGTATVSVGEADGVLTVEVTDDGLGAPAADAARAAGHGIRGMRERAALYGGVLLAGPRPGGGWQVVLRLPTGRPDPEPGPELGPELDSAPRPTPALEAR